MTLPPLKHHRSLSVMPTFRCTAACTHCGTFSNTSDRHPSLSRNEVMKAIDEAGAAGYVVVVFTGGEPTLALEVVLEGIVRSRSHGMGTRVVTNASWASSDEAAIEMVARLVAAGLNEINFSTGIQHQRFVPLENILRAVRAALDGGLKTVCVMIEVTASSPFRAESLAKNPEYVAALAAHPEAGVSIVESPWMPTRPGMVETYPDGMLVNRSNVYARSGCTSCLYTTTLQADGRIAACCGLGMRTIPELQLGHVSTTTLTEADAMAANDFLKRWIKIEGPERILAWAAEHDPQIEWEDMYAHKCQACLRLYKDDRVRAVVTEHHREKMADVILSEYLLAHFPGGVSSGRAVREEHVVA